MSNTQIFWAWMAVAVPVLFALMYGLASLFDRIISHYCPHWNDR